MGPDPEGAACFLGVRRTLHCPSSKQGVRGSWGFPGSASGKETAWQCSRHKKPQVRSRGEEDPLKKGMATHSSIRAWRIPWTEEPGGLQSMRSRSQPRLKRQSTRAHIQIWSFRASEAHCLAVKPPVLCPCHSRPCLVASTAVFRT